MPLLASSDHLVGQLLGPGAAVLPVAGAHDRRADARGGAEHDGFFLGRVLDEGVQADDLGHAVAADVLDVLLEVLEPALDGRRIGAVERPSAPRRPGA